MLGRWGRSDGRLSGPQGYNGPRVEIPPSVACAAKQLFKLPTRHLTNPWGYNSLRVILGLVLLVAASLKTHQLATEPVLGTGLLDSRWLLIAVVEFELLLGLCLLANVWPRATWAVALSCFSLFTCVSLYKAVSGHTTCGCFGRVAINPWYTAALDLGVVILLLVWRPRGQELAVPGRLEPLPRRAIAVLTTWLCVGLAAGLAMGSYAETTLSEAGEIIGDGKIVVLKPETWVGKQFPLLSHTDIGRKLARGMWVVLLHRQDCSACREAAAEYEALAKEFSARANCPRVALIECRPDRQDSATAAHAPLVTGRLTDAREWRLAGPASVLIDDGRVQSVFRSARDIELLRAIWGTGDN